MKKAGSTIFGSGPVAAGKSALQFSRLQTGVSFGI